MPVEKITWDIPEYKEIEPRDQRRPSHAQHFARRASAATALAVRRPSAAVLHAAGPYRITPPEHKTGGNPLGIKLDDPRRASSAGQSPAGTFNGRRPSQASALRSATRSENYTPNSRRSSRADTLRTSTSSASYSRLEGVSEKEEDHIIQSAVAQDDNDRMPKYKRFILRLNPWRSDNRD